MAGCRGSIAGGCPAWSRDRKGKAGFTVQVLQARPAWDRGPSRTRTSMRGGECFTAALTPLRQCCVGHCAALVHEARWRFASAGRSALKLVGAAAGLFFEFLLQRVCRCPLPFANAVTSGKLFNLLNLGFHVSKKG